MELEIEEFTKLIPEDAICNLYLFHNLFTDLILVYGIFGINSVNYINSISTIKLISIYICNQLFMVLL